MTEYSLVETGEYPSDVASFLKNARVAKNSLFIYYNLWLQIQKKKHEPKDDL